MAHSDQPVQTVHRGLREAGNKIAAYRRLREEIRAELVADIEEHERVGRALTTMLHEVDRDLRGPSAV